MKINTLLRAAVMLLSAPISLPVLGRVVVVNTTPHTVRLMAFYQTIDYPFQVTWDLKKKDFQILEGDDGATKYRYVLWSKDLNGVWQKEIDTREDEPWASQLYHGNTGGNLIDSAGDRKVTISMLEGTDENPQFVITNEYVPYWDTAINNIYKAGYNQLQTLGWWNNMYSGRKEEGNRSKYDNLKIDKWSHPYFFGYGAHDAANPAERYLRKH